VLNANYLGTLIAVQQSLRYFALAAIREQGEHMTCNGNGSAGLGHGYYFEDLSVGMDASYAKRITNEDILAFAELSGDVNPIHLSDEFAASTMFKKRIAHGFLTGSLFSTVLGTKLPGPGCVYLSQTMKFRGPVYIGDEVVATLKITALDPDKARVTLACDCSVNGKTVLEGEALMMVDRRAPRQ
jgi:3-hydroxybutyryl-CoA dehydratase